MVAELRSWAAATFVGAKAFAAQDALDTELVREAASLGCAVPRRKLVQARPLREPLRSETWAQGAKAAFALDAALDRALLGGAPSTRLPAMILASAILRGGLLRAEAWPVLLDALRARTLTLSRAADLEDMPWIDLALPSGTTSRPVSEDGVEWVRVWPDVVTLSLLGRWQAEGIVPVPPVSTPAEALQIVWNALGPDGACPRPAVLGEAAIAVLEDRSRMGIPYAVGAAATGEIVVTCLPPAAWTAFWTGQRPGLVAPAPPRNARPRSATADRKVRSGDTADLAHLRAALTAVPGAAARSARANARCALDGLAAAGLVPALEAARRWFLGLLRQNRPLAVSSLQRYLSALTPFLQLVGPEDPAGWDADRLGAIARLAARAGRDGEGEIYRAARIGQFCGFAARDPDLRWPRLEAGKASETGERPVVRAALLSPADIAAIRTAIRRQHPMQIQADPYEVGMLMLGRGGLRVSETAGLLAGDIRRSGAISVHATRLAALKSEAGRRKVPLSQLLEGEDLALWDRFCARRRRQVLSPDREPFLARPDLLDPEAFDVAELRALLAPLGFSPHDLRHTALSRLALVLYADEAATAVTDIGAILQRLTGWSPALQARIRRLFLGEIRDGRRAGHQLRLLAGHGEAETTFRSYVHTMDLLLGLFIRFLAETRSVADARRILGLNGVDAGAGEGEVSLEGLRPAVLARLTLTTLARDVAGPPEPVPVRAVTRPLSPALAEAVLAALDRGQTAAEVAGDHGLSEAAVRSLDQRARSLMRRTTRGGAPRQRSQARAAPPSSRRPAPLRSGADRSLAHRIATAVLAGPEPRPWAETIWRQSDPWRPGLRFDHPERAGAWLAALSGIVPANAWDAQLQLAPAHEPSVACGRWHGALGDDTPIRVVAGATLSGRSRWGRLCLGFGTSGPDGRPRSAFPALRHAGFLVALLADLPAT